MPNNQNNLITGDLSCTIKNLDELLRFLCAAGEDSEVCDPGLAHGLRLAQGASSWIKSNLQGRQGNALPGHGSEEIRS
ncbi:conserved hypothetical protein [Vibrio crassostreae]|nr:conserved hypothetical protein [Vibrio crassostreae]CAK2372455.1 conserved hypothetical protein [Vibrio crassostreae]CAK2910345.1 conserved hypothetical protein [Vibrio crassostreae]CAK2984966.1 conserved hypothetical protein [Vibrio crassostreae]CAK3521930.1 conserved hypothetical protein [Vibrio crassostreae]